MTTFVLAFYEIDRPMEDPKKAASGTIPVNSCASGAP